MPASKVTETIATLPALSTLGGAVGEPVVDFFIDPRASLEPVAASKADAGLVVRVGPPLPEPREGFGPAPVPFLWMRVTRGAREIGLAGASDGMVRRVSAVRVDRSDQACCDAASCDRRREIARVAIVLEPVAGDVDHLIVAEDAAMVGDAPSALPEVIARELADLFGVSVEGEAREVPASTPSAARVTAPLEELARFAMRREGERVVVRDWQGQGPRASVPRNTTIGVLLLLLALGAWVALARAVTSGAGSSEIAGAAAAAVLLSLAGYAFVGVARFSAKYASSSTALVAIGRDQLIVLPWVGRDGAVDRRPEGRLGAAIPLGEVRLARTRAFGDGIALEIDTDHGVLDAMTFANDRSAQVWVEALNRTIDAARHPRVAGATAKQRARERATTS